MTATDNFLKTKTQLGSIKNSKINYTSDQNYFTGGDDEKIRAGVTKVVESVKDEIDRDTLGTKRPKWNTSVGIVGHPQPNDL